MQVLHDISQGVLAHSSEPTKSQSQPTTQEVGASTPSVNTKRNTASGTKRAAGVKVADSYKPRSLKWDNKLEAAKPWQPSDSKYLMALCDKLEAINTELRAKLSTGSK